MTAQPASFGAAATDVLAGFSRIRETAETFMDKRDRAGDGWNEEAVTAVSVIEGRPHVQVVEFNRSQEGRGPNALGADYLWWWIDSSRGECFGMLVQAKRLTLSGEQWHVDIRHREGGQLSDLLRTADELGVPAVYGVYTGGLVYRAALPCLHRQTSGPMDAAPAPPASSPATGLPGEQECGRCRRMAISMVTAYQLTSNWQSKVMTGRTVLTESVPIEDLVDPAVPSGRVWDVNLRDISDRELRSFLVRPQEGAREIARRIFRLVAHRRSMAFSAAAPELVTVAAGAPVFPDVPEDRGHFPGPYYRHVLQGLRTSPPAYVEDLLRLPTSAEIWDLGPVSNGTIGRIVAGGSGRRQPPELQGTNVAGVVLVTV